MEQKHDIVLYQIDDTNVCVSVYFEDETFWLTTKAMAELFGVKSQAIEKATKEYDIFRVRQDQEYVSEFDKQTEKYFKGE